MSQNGIARIPTRRRPKQPRAAAARKSQIPVKPDAKDSHTKPAQGPGARNRQTTLILSFLYPKIPPTHPSIAARKAVRPARKRDSGKITTSPSSPPTTPSERDYRHPSCCDERISGLLWILAGLRLKRDSISTRWIDCDCCVVYCVGLQDCCCCFGGN